MIRLRHSRLSCSSGASVRRKLSEKTEITRPTILQCQACAQCKKKRNSWIHFGKRVTQNIDSISFTKWTNIRHRSESRDKLDGAETVTSYENKRIIWVGNVGRWYETGIYCTTIIPTKFSEITSFISLSASRMLNFSCFQPDINKTFEFSLHGDCQNFSCVLCFMPWIVSKILRRQCGFVQRI